MRSYYRLLIGIIFIFIFNSCATYTTQVKNINSTNQFPNKEISHSFYLIGDAGNSDFESSSDALKFFKSELTRASKNSTAIFLGDNIYPKGLPSKGDKSRTLAEHRLNLQTDAVRNFKGNTIFIPGNHDWYSNGLKGLKRQERFIEKKLGKNSFLPENGCPIQKIHINSAIDLIIVDSQWYLTNWNKHPTINDDCEIKTREKFFMELESLVKKARSKTTLIAMHHPMFSDGPHGGQYDFKSGLNPAPVLGIIKNIIRKTSGLSTQDIQNKRYNEFRKRVITLAQQNDKTIIVSGHDHNLQYLKKENTPQIISGSGSKNTATRNVDGEFTSSDSGFARLDIFSDGSSMVRFYSTDIKSVIYQTEVLRANHQEKIIEYSNRFPSTVKASVYTQNEVAKGKSYTKFWGERYRKYYGIKVLAPTVNLDTLFGGLKPVRKGGGHQSKSLRMADKKGREYVMRALRKNAVQYLQSVVFKDQYIEGNFDYNYSKGLLLDVFTGAHPYAPFVVGTLADAIDVYHTNPVLYYIPKQNALGKFNDEFGNELYMIEEQAGNGHGDLASFGHADKIISTDDLLKNLRKNDNYYVDEESYVRARLFDMLIGDWDRHEDQWRWATFKSKDDNTMYRPIPRDRDQAFSIMADGVLLKIATTLIPGLRLMRSYDDELRSPKWFNTEPYPLDMALINNADKNIWDKQVNIIKKNLTDNVIENAFANLPNEVKDKSVQVIKRKLKGRLENLQMISDKYYGYLNKYAVIKGTDKDDYFEIIRLDNGKTEVKAYRIIDGKKGRPFHNRIYDRMDTREIWIYGLDDTDKFKVIGNGSNLIKLRIIGGQNRDNYDIENGKKVVIYDYKSKKNEFKTDKGHKILTDNYDVNVYDYKKLKNSANQLIPTIGANPDDGFKLGFTNTYTLNGFERNPFTQQHTFSTAYYFSTKGYDLSYNGEFDRVFGNTNFGLEAKYTSPNFSINFFGFGNSTPNFDDDQGLNFNRVKLRTFKIAPYFVWRGQLGATFKASLTYESIEVESTTGRFINDYLNMEDDVNQNTIGANLKYQYSNYDNNAFPTLGMMTALEVGYKINDNSISDNGFAFIVPEFGLDYKLVPSGRVVLASKIKAYINIGDDFEFYQAASIGGNDGLRGYRFQRFTGKQSFYQNTDLRIMLRKLKTGLMPFYLGIYGGFDYGRVWANNSLVQDPNFNMNNWNTSVGGGIFFNAANKITGNMAAFNSDDGLRLAFSIGVAF